VFAEVDAIDVFAEVDAIDRRTGGSLNSSVKFAAWVFGKTVL
jgi:hypothetical protein